MKNPYEILGVSPTATDDEVKQAWRALARKYHPDKYRDSDLADLASEKMKEINAAYEEIQKMRASGGSSSRTGNSGSYSGNPHAEGTSDAQFAEIRRMINENRIAEAEGRLRAMPASRQTAEWYFLYGCVLYKKGYFLDAQSMLDRACGMDPANVEYRDARDRLRAQASTYGRGYRTSSSSDSCCDACSTLICADCCCECMGGDLIPCC